MKKFWNWLKGLFGKGETYDDGSSSGLGGIFNSQNWRNQFDSMVNDSDYLPGQNNSLSDTFSNLFGSSFSDLMKALTNRVTANNLTGAEREQNAFNASEAQKQRNFELQMSRTEYQRAVQDMQAAGVNPAMAMNNGGNSSPSGVAASGSGSGQYQSMSDLMQLAFIKPQIEKLKNDMEVASKNADTARINAETARYDAETRRSGLGLQSEELRTVKQPLAKNQIAVGDTVVTLNESRSKNVDKATEQLGEDIALTKLHQIATFLDIKWKDETWSDNKRLLSENIAKTTAERAYTNAMSDKASEETRRLVQDNNWNQIYIDYWSDPKNSDRGVNFQMLQGTNIGAAGIAYIQALGDNLDENREEELRQYRSDTQKGGSR